MSDGGDAERIWIESTMDSTTGRPMCFIRWGDKQKLVETERVIATARELFAAAIASILDVRIRYTLAEHDFDIVAIDQFMNALSLLNREGGADEPR